MEVTDAVVALPAAEFARRRDELASLLADAVEDNASVGFVLPVEQALLHAYWQSLEAAVGDGSRVVLAALAGDRIVGSVQLAYCTKPNQPHRAEVQKLLVHRDARGRGIAGRLMDALERRALEAGRWLLVLDTRSGSVADRLYRQWGWQTVGQIPDYALDPDGTLAACTFHWKRLA
jgi:ribosomal protein S18 acetylase RimI-like enzyme